MHKLIIHKLGPIEHCELECSQFMTLTGYQASGKSTIAKAFYFFRTIKDDIIDLAKKQGFNIVSVDSSNAERNIDLKRALINTLREKFLRTFGSSWSMDITMYLEYHYTASCSIKISLKEDILYFMPNYIWITLSIELRDFLEKKNNCLSMTPLGVAEQELSNLQTEVYNIFDDRCAVVYIPAGRSMMTLLSQQFNYIYATMDEVQKRSLDSCTRDYLERILRLKPEFANGLYGMAANSLGPQALSPQIVHQALELIKKILQGTYRYSNGEEQIVLDDGKYVKINFSSSGQQESVWILNLLYYYLLQQKPILFIIEEPESHLFPEAQKYITELIALVNNSKHSVILTTHSPYVLGTLNNLLYANTISDKLREKTNAIIPGILWLEYDNFHAWFVKKGTVEDCMDVEVKLIQNQKIDEISKTINEEFDQLFELQMLDEEGLVM